MRKRMIAVAAVAAVLAVAGCGSDGSMMHNQGSVAVSGRVADGYLENATVFLDRNGNYRLDAGEPSATTDASGAYALTVDPADVGRYPIVALARQGVTIDSDNPGVPLTNSYVLSLPKESVSGTVSGNFISPMSTLIREMVETGGYATVQQAMEALRASLGMPAGTNMMADYILAQNAAMHNAAQNMATVMGGQFGNYSGATGIDVNRYRGMIGTMFSNMSSVRVAGTQQTMTEVMSTMTSSVGGIGVGMPFMNMSSYFRGGMMGGGMGR